MVRFPHFSLVNNVPLYIDIDIEQLVYLSIDGNSDCFHVLVIVNSDGMSGVQISFLISLFVTLGCILRSGTAEFYGRENN